MAVLNKEIAIEKITKMPAERVSKVLICMEGMEAEHLICKESEAKKQRNPTSNLYNIKSKSVFEVKNL